ncbi:non-ribosomal peptide synthetase module [Paenibacillus sp. y28]|uniref:non-ribosomal peptide synthetase module n=1 Tax=Paenibacillus sp. y28 TaxID=3129110 RepID=UPI003015C995
MAQRLGTEYVKTCLNLSEADLGRLFKLFSEENVQQRVKVFENGSQEVVLHDDAGEEIVLAFERRHGRYVCEGACRMKSTKLVNAMRKAVAAFKGDAVVRRHYTGYHMDYVYAAGSVVRITEVKQDAIKLVYEYKDTLGQLERLFNKRAAEQEITLVQQDIDFLLDQRNLVTEPERMQEIDAELTRLTHRLFVLEA